MNHFSAPLLLQAIFSLETVYALTGDALFIFAALTVTDRKHPHPYASGSFWLILGAIFAFGTHLPHWVTGLLVIVMVALDGIGRVKPPSDNSNAHLAGAPKVPIPTSSETHQPAIGNGIFLPVLTIP